MKIMVTLVDSMIRIEGLSARQVKIADLLWSCTSEQAKVFCKDPEVAVVRDMIVAAMFDKCDDTNLAREILDNLK